MAIDVAPPNTPQAVRTDPQPSRAGTLKNGAAPHILTAEERRRGGLASQERKRELRMGILERTAKKLDEKADKLVDRIIQEVEQGDWRAYQMLMEQTFGRPAIELTGADGGPIELEVSAVRERLAERLEAVRERSGS